MTLLKANKQVYTVPFGKAATVDSIIFYISLVVMLI